MKLKDVKRFSPSYSDGLSDEQVKYQFQNNLYNYNADLPSKSLKRIIADNILTLFNLLNIALGIAVFLVGSYKNLIFLGVMLCNIVIGIFQEVRAKKNIDKLSIISSNKVKVIRNGTTQMIGVNEIVLDDIIELSNGNQVPSDCIIVNGECDVNESLLTGESDAVHKKNGDMLLSGSFIISGRVRAKVEHIGEYNYASSISKEAKYFKKVKSEIMQTVKKIIKFVSILVLPVGTLLFINQINMSNNTIEQAVINTVAAILGMIPEGLVLLTSTVLAVGVIRLSKQSVLVQELYCIETLARVDVLCLDKTGTITEGCMIVNDTIPYGTHTKSELEEILSLLSDNLTDDSPTFNAIKDKYSLHSNIKADKIVPFSSDKKWSGAYFKNKGSYIIGAVEFILDNIPYDIKNIINKISYGNRVISVVYSNENFDSNNNKPKNLQVIGFVSIKDKVRSDVKETLEYFDDEKVNIKIISGDNVLTVASVAKEAGVKNADKYIDASTLKTDEEIEKALSEYTVFGRVTPQQKKKFVIALKKQGHSVAMTGDGVNDVLALKEADCSIAMASGSDAARNVSQIVLVNSNFSAMPRVLAEGRRSINNLERSSTLFIVKSIYCTLLAILFVFLNSNYPFMPIQMTLINIFTIGIPSFILALESNKNRVKGHLLRNILSKSLPAAIGVVFSIVGVEIVSCITPISTQEYSTMCVLLSAAMGFALLCSVSIPFNILRGSLVLVLVAGISLAILLFHWLFSLVNLSVTLVLSTLVIFAISLCIFIIMLKIMKKFSL